MQLHLANSKTVSSDGTDGEWLVRLMNTLVVANWLSGQCKLFVPYSRHLSAISNCFPTTL